LDAFGLPVPGRDSPGRLRRNLSMPNSDDNGALPEVGRGPLPADLNADPAFNPSIHYEYTRRDPMGAIFLDLFGEIVTLSGKSNKAMTVDIDDICQRFHNHSIAEKQRVNRRIMQTTAELERSMIEKELNSHALNQVVEAPSTFSAAPTLITPRQTADCHKLLPSGSSKFSGTPGGISIVEYLYNLNRVQEQCNLSLEEFYNAMLASTTGAPYTYIMGAIKNNEDPANIYHNLLLRYDKRLQPEEARIRLHAYKIPKNKTLAEAETHIHELATRATSALPEGPPRAIACNYEEVQALLRALPAQSATLVRNLYSNLSNKLGESATASDLSRLLNTYRHSIDEDIRQHGQGNNRPFEARRFMKRAISKPVPGKRFTSYNVTQQSPATPTDGGRAGKPFGQPRTAAPAPWRPKPFSGAGQSSGPRGPLARTDGFRPFNFRPKTGNFGTRTGSRPMNGRTGGFMNRPRSRTPGFGGRATGTSNRGRPNNMGRKAGNYRGRPNVRDYCSLCGKNDHKAVDGCPYMVSDSGKVIPIMPCKDTCPLCPSHVRIPLNHPSFVCPFRVPHGPLSNK